jgi:hypothetical protein
MSGGTESEALLAPREGAARVEIVERAREPLASSDLLDEVDEYFAAGARVAPGDVVVDVGANEGAFALRVAQRTRGCAHLHCFEPAPAIFAALERTQRATAGLREARLHRVALTAPEHAGRPRAFYYFARIPTNSTYDLGDKLAEYEAYFRGKARRLEAWLALSLPWIGALLGAGARALVDAFCDRRNRVWAWLALRATGLVRTTCETDSLERWAARERITRIDLLKIDVEGAELDVLAGLGPLWPHVRQIALETHAREGRAARVEALLRAHGFDRLRTTQPRITEQTGLDNVLIVAERSAPQSTGEAR